MMKGVWKATRRYITLVEIMIVITLIAMILGVLAVNYQGALETGRAFETRANIQKIRSALTLKVASDPSVMGNVGEKWRDYLKNSPLISDPDKMTRDGWGEEFKVSVETIDGSQVIQVTSNRLDEYDKANK